ncbi:MAG: methyltransferase domain-containing protein [Candidatus Aenigmarchaeota archaeon]|nr:methyltransferase domain-containing protein [Candidatus Aenigmarchaeota archaeon]
MIEKKISKFKDSLVFFDKNMHPAFGIKKILFDGNSKFQKIQVAEFYGLGKGLILNGESQFFETDEELYHSSFVEPVLKNKVVEKILILGGGDGGVAREALKHSIKEIKIVDIDERVTEVAKKYFKNFRKVFSNPKVKIINQDAFHFVLNNDERFDVIFVDLTDFEIKESSRQVNRLYQIGFIKSVKKLLRKNGVLVYQISGYYTYPEAVKHMRKVFKNVFKSSHVYGVFIPTFFDLWCFIAGSDKQMDLAADKSSKMFNVFEITKKPEQVKTL